MTDEVRLTVANDADVLVARRAGRRLGEGLGFSLADLAKVTTAITEAASRVVSIGGGELTVRVECMSGRSALAVEVVDDGPGVGEVDSVLEEDEEADPFSGLAEARRLMDELEVHPRAGSGTRIVMRKWAANG